MMTFFARIVGGVVAELIEVEADGPTIMERFHPDLVAAMVLVPEGAEVAEGWTWSGEACAPPAPVEAPEPPIPTVTARQLRLWLVLQGRTLGLVDAAIAALPEEQRAPAQIEWEYATTYVRAHPLIGALGAALGFSAEEIDAGFREAAVL